ncbi:MAG: Cysteine--tRNA ligase [Desulfonauticus sp. 38_4375]|nr:MAG: Cysteine--tRNA ligase [Desulfonauticus sp. 38_4375]
MKIYNSLKREKEEFVPLRDNEVRMYVCGITAYDYCHIGHARSAVVFDVLVRYLRDKGYKVIFVRNFTDIDDKIINRAHKENLPWDEVARKYIEAFYEDMDRLNILRADIEPKATEHIEEMIELTQKLIDMGFAYVTSRGDVYFRVRKFKTYGELSGRNIEELQAGARIEPGEEKEDPLDFALWKSAKPGEPKWPSPWGEGRPGWHLECSAMSEKYLGLPFDIHGGGQDLIFPHHENEKAQSEAAYSTSFVRYWVHNGFVQVNSEKMSKSLGNFVTIRDILNNYHPEVLRFFLLTKHYRSPLDYNLESVEEAEKGLKRIYQAVEELEAILSNKKWKKVKVDSSLIEEIKEQQDKFFLSLEDDLNTAKAIGYLFNTVRIVNRIATDKNLRKAEPMKDVLVEIREFLTRAGKILGVLNLAPAVFLEELKDIQLKRKNIAREEVEALIAKRQDARKNKDFALADSLREQLVALGIEVKDTPAGPVWEVVS